MAIKITDFSFVYIGTLHVSSWGFVRESRSRYRSRSLNHKMACYDDEKRAISRINIVKRIHDVCVQPKAENARLFIASEVKTPRDIYRNSGYKIVRDRDNADYTVIPAINNITEQLQCDYAVKDEDGRLFLYSVDKNSRGKEEADKEALLEHIKAYFATNKNITPLWDGIRNNSPIYFIPDYQDYKDILNGMYLDRRYAMDTYIPLHQPVQINPETLQIWKRYTDLDMLAKAIVASNWQEYPITLLCFLHRFQKHIDWVEGRGIETVLKQIGYDSMDDLGDILADRIVQPQDYEMLQRWILDEVQLSEAGGFTTEEAYGRLGILSRFIKTAIYIVPMKITTPVTTENIIQMAAQK